MRNILLLLLSFVAINVSATTWHVGPLQTYTMPSQVSTLVQNGDTVLIDSGLYESDVAAWAANDLVIKGIGGKAQLFSNGLVYGGKAIWVIQGDNATIENIEFAEAACVDLNGAGMRQEGTNLTVRYCYFHDNENGILSGADAASIILIEYSEFYNNGYGDGYSHNLYIGHVNGLIFQYNYTHHADIGHELKSRAEVNYILYNRFGEEATGTASRSIDLPNGGKTVILGNVIEQGPNSDNSNIIGYGLEGTSNLDSTIFIVNNTIVNNKAGGSFVQVQNTTAYVMLRNNILAGPGTVFSGIVNIDSVDNLITSITGVGFVDAPNYDFHLLGTSPAINLGLVIGFGGGMDLLPLYEYADTANKVARTIVVSPDAGAYEYHAPISVEQYRGMPQFALYPNPAKDVVNVQVTGVIKQLSLYDNTGKLVQTQTVKDNKATFVTNNCAAGLYFLKGEQGGAQVIIVR